MAKGYRPVLRDQEFLLPPRMTDWLPDDHLVWFALDVVAELDTSRLHERAARRRDGQVVRSAAGRAAYDPDMLLALLIYAYAGGERSSRRIELDPHLRTPEDTALYARRGTTAEPGTSNSKKLLTRSSRHSLATATSEAQLTTTAFNLLKPHRTTPHNPRGPTGRPGTWSSIPTPAQPGVNEHQQDHQT